MLPVAARPHPRQPLVHPRILATVGLASPQSGVTSQVDVLALLPLAARLHPRQPRVDSSIPATAGSASPHPGVTSQADVLAMLSAATRQHTRQAHVHPSVPATVGSAVVPLAAPASLHQWQTLVLPSFLAIVGSGVLLLAAPRAWLHQHRLHAHRMFQVCLPLSTLAWTCDFIQGCCIQAVQSRPRPHKKSGDRYEPQVRGRARPPRFNILNLALAASPLTECDGAKWPRSAGSRNPADVEM